MPTNQDNALGHFLKDRRSKLDPASFGFPLTRRRTPGLRREEVALRANVSPTWYTWLEQGRGGVPSTDVLDRLAKGLSLTEAEREHLFLLAQHRPPEVELHEPAVVAPELLRVLESLEFSPALIRNSAWDALAANRAARVVLAPHTGTSEPHNILENFFDNASVQGSELSPAWTRFARSLVAQFRAEAFRTGFGRRAQEVVESLSRRSDAFSRLWNDLDVGLIVENVKTFSLPGRGTLTFETASFAVDAHPGLKMMTFTPATPGDRARVQELMAEDLA